MLAIPCTSGDTCVVVVLRSIGGATASSGRVNAFRIEQGGLFLSWTLWVFPWGMHNSSFYGLRQAVRPVWSLEVKLSAIRL